MSHRKTLTRKNRISSIIQVKTPQDEEVELLYKTILQRQKNGYESTELIPSDPQAFELIKYILLKPVKLTIEIHIIKIYLFSLDKFIKIFRSISDENISLDDLVSKIGGQLKCEFIPKNSIICKQGDKGDKCYVVFTGSISILIQKEYLIKISEVDYIKFLIRLSLYCEYDLMNRVLLINRSKFLIEEKDIISIITLFRVYKYFIDYMGRRYKYISDFLKSEKEAEDLLNEKYECNILSVLQFFPLDELQLNEVFEYYESVYDKIGDITQRIYPKNSHKISLEEFKREVYLSIINNNSNSDNGDYYNKIYTASIEEYCNRFIPCVASSSFRTLPFELKLFSYVEVVSLREGSIFGDVALQKVSQKRTATVITKTDCVFGTLTKGSYDLCLKGTQDKVRLWNVYFFLNGPLFKEVNQIIFESKYFNFFKQEELKRGESIFNNGKEKSTIYFIKQGELEVSSKLTFKQMNHVIRSLGGYLNEEVEKKFACRSVQFDYYYNQQPHFFRFCFLKDKEIAGLDDFIIDDKYFCDCYCSSSKVNVFSLEKQFYLNLIADKQIKKNIEGYVVKKRKVFLDLLLSVRQAMLSNEINKIEIDEKALSEQFFNDRKKVKVNKVKTTHSILLKTNTFNKKFGNINTNMKMNMSNEMNTQINKEDDNNDSVFNKAKSRNNFSSLGSIPNTTSRKLKPSISYKSSSILTNKLIKSKMNNIHSPIRILNHNKHFSNNDNNYPVNQKMMKILDYKKRMNTSPTNSLPTKKDFVYSPSPEERLNTTLRNSLSKTLATIHVPLTISRMKKVILPASNSSGFKEYKTFYTESRSLRTDNFFYKNIHVFDKILNQKQLPKAKRGYIDCLVLDKWEEENNNNK